MQGYVIAAWSLWGLTLVFAGLGIVVLVLGWDTADSDAWGFRGQSALVAITLSTVGLVISLKKPSNAIGWIMCSAGLLAGIQESSIGYATYAIVANGQTGFPAELSAWLGNWLWIPLSGTMAIGVFMLFPDGRFMSARWRFVAVAAALATIMLTVTISLLPGPLDNTPYLVNPFGFDSLDGWLPVPGSSLNALMVVPLAAAAGSLVVRFRRARAQERQQMKWLAAVAVALVVTMPFNMLPLKVFQYLTICVILAMPVAVGVAILRYRLYDIDLIINKALVYGALTIALGLTYVGVVLLLQAVFRQVTGQESTLALVTSTLAIAALFQPMRRRTQGFIDRRFYRRKYDAGRILTAFAATARDEVDLGRLSDAIFSAVSETVQPAHVSLWMREPAVLQKADRVESG